MKNSSFSASLKTLSSSCDSALFTLYNTYWSVYFYPFTLFLHIVFFQLPVSTPLFSTLPNSLEDAFLSLKGVPLHFNIFPPNPGCFGFFFIFIIIMHMWKFSGMINNQGWNKIYGGEHESLSYMLMQQLKDYTENPLVNIWLTKVTLTLGAAWSHVQGWHIQVTPDFDNPCISLPATELAK